MKIRMGFVSNSSSSSFILASPLSGDALREKLEKVFGLGSDVSGKSYPVKEFATNIGKRVYNHLDETSFSTKEKYLEDIHCTEKEARESKEYSIALDFIEKGFTIYSGGFDDQSDGLNRAFCKSDIFYEDSELYIYQEWGY